MSRSIFQVPQITRNTTDGCVRSARIRFGIALRDTFTRAIRESYDRLAPEYARRIADELRRKRLDRQLLDRLATKIGSTGEICDVGCGPGHVARYLRDGGASVFGLDGSPKMLEEARQLNPDILFRPGDMLALDIPSGSLAGIPLSMRS